MDDADISFKTVTERFRECFGKMINWLDSGRIVHSDVPMIITIFQQEVYGFNFRKLKIRSYINDGLINSVKVLIMGWLNGRRLRLRKREYDWL
jgi:predicted glycoside hydrolase/deacetylase ChbG (UPF0249 family)